jgi:hypothetical protein
MKTFNGYGVMDSTFVTGELPVQAFGVCGGREDFDSRECRSMWAGCIDAVEYIATGGMKIVKSEGVIVPGSRPR